MRGPGCARVWKSIIFDARAHPQTSWTDAAAERATPRPVRGVALGNTQSRASKPQDLGAASAHPESLSMTPNNVSLPDGAAQSL